MAQEDYRKALRLGQKEFRSSVLCPSRFRGQ